MSARGNQRRGQLAIIGTGASALYLLQNMLDQGAARLFAGVTLYEANGRPGMGMPYNPATTDRYNICNISSEEMPPLTLTLVDWMHRRSDAELAEHGLKREEIDPAETYARVVFGAYFADQLRAVVDALRVEGVAVEVLDRTPVADLIDDPGANRVTLVTAAGDRTTYDRVVIATGHHFDDDDDAANGYYASPWPMHKLLPADGIFHNFPVATLGASLSAFDVVASISHRHGTFTPAGEDGAMKFVPHAGAEDFRLVLHSSEGWLPHLQYEQEEPMRQVYRHVGREELLGLRDGEGFLRLGTYFERVCRPALAEALRADGREDVAGPLASGELSMEAFVEMMEAEHTYDDAFEGMRRELPEARRSLDADRPIHWKEVLDDLMYALNYHAELMPAEDHVTLRKTVMPFLMNVIAAMPLASARTLLALRDAGRLELVTGRVEVESKGNGVTRVRIDDDGDVSTAEHRMFVDCSGQAPVTVDDYPFRSLVDAGTVRPARARFADPAVAGEVLEDHPDKRTEDDGHVAMSLPGIDIDPGYRVIGTDGRANRRVLDIGFPHTLGVRPYSYGLQACNHTAEMVVATWLREAAEGRVGVGDVEVFAELEAAVPGER